MFVVASVPSRADLKNHWVDWVDLGLGPWAWGSAVGGAHTHPLPGSPPGLP